MNAMRALAVGAIAAVVALGCGTRPVETTRPAGAPADERVPQAAAEAATPPVPEAPEWLGRSTRAEIAVNEAWEAATTRDASLRAPGNGWRSAAVPGRVHDSNCVPPTTRTTTDLQQGWTG